MKEREEMKGRGNEREREEMKEIEGEREREGKGEREGRRKGRKKGEREEGKKREGWRGMPSPPFLSMSFPLYVLSSLCPS